MTDKKIPDRIDDLQLNLTLDGVQYSLRPGDFTGEDDLAVYQTVGISITDIFLGKLTLFTIAALIWRYRLNNGEPKVTFEKVNKQMTFSVLETVTDDDDASDDEDGQEGGAPEG